MKSGYHWFVLDVNPEPWAIGPLGVSRKSGKLIPYVGRNMQLHAYKEAIKEALGTEPGVWIEGKVQLRMYFWRQRAEYSTPQARTHRKHEADVTNLQKATEDALQGVLFKNDKDVNDIHSIMVEQGPNVRGKVVIGIKANQEMPVNMALFPAEVSLLINEIDDPDPDWMDNITHPPNKI